MTDQFVAEIRIFPYNFPPKGWAFCNGQLLPISQNTALFSLLGTFYGGDGKSTFALPNLEGSVVIHAGNGPGPGLSSYQIGQVGGSDFVTLLESEMPAHSHTHNAVNAVGNRTTPIGNSLARTTGATPYAPGNPALGAMGFQAISIAGGSLPHNNLQPYLTLNYNIALQGAFPARH